MPKDLPYQPSPTSADAALIDDFLAALSAERRPSRRTLTAYRADLRLVAAALPRRSGAAPLRDASQADLVERLEADRAAGLSASTRARRLSSLRGFYRHLRREGGREDDPTIGLSNKKPTQPPQRALALTEIDRIVAVAEQMEGAAGARATACVELLYSAGLRVSELTNLKDADLRGAPPFLRIYGKGQVERLTPLGPSAQRAIARWLPYRDAGKGAAGPWAFPAGRGGGPMARQTLFRLLKKLAAQAGVSADAVSPHAFRRSFATHLLEGGADLRSIQTLLGHADIAATEAYARFADDHLTKVVLERHPLAKV
ncbi:MAG: tyrosine-type recombinase/integrase [Neomegalonema sp.]|nr:tyrosine-type recombinase/integrase [Neomegalonema sp.]